MGIANTAEGQVQQFPITSFFLVKFGNRKFIGHIIPSYMRH